MATDITKSGTKTKVTEAGKEPIYLPSQDLFYQFDSEGTTLHLKEKGGAGYPPHSYAIPLSDLTISGSAPASKAAALTALATVFS